MANKGDFVVFNTGKYFYLYSGDRLRRDPLPRRLCLLQLCQLQLHRASQWRRGGDRRRKGTFMKHTLIIALALMASPAAAGNLTGPAYVIDGDTIIVAGVHVRLNGVDAPEVRPSRPAGGRRFRRRVARRACARSSTTRSYAAT